MTSESLHSLSRKTGQQVLMAFLGFFIICSSVNAFFVYKAIDSYSGVVTENAYEKGLKFNDVIAEAKKRQKDKQIISQTKE